MNFPRQRLHRWRVAGVDRCFQTLPIGAKPTFIDLKVPRVLCFDCGKLRQVNINFAEPKKHYTRSFERYALELSRHMTIKDVAQHLQVSWDTIKDIQGDFVQTYEGGVLRTKTTERGSLKIKRPGRIRFTYTKPERKEFVSDGVRLYTHLVADKQVIVSPAPSAEDGDVPAMFLAGRSAIDRPSRRAALPLRIFGFTSGLISSVSKSRSQRSGVISGKSEPNSTLSCSSVFA